MIDLRPDHLELAKRILRRQAPDVPVWVFGSRVTGKAKPHSDLDLALVTEQPLSWETRVALEEAFSESDLPIRVDLVDWATTSGEFRNVIQATHEVIQEGAGSHPLST